MKQNLNFIIIQYTSYRRYEAIMKQHTTALVLGARNYEVSHNCYEEHHNAANFIMM